MPTWNNLQLPNANSPMMENMILFHDYIMMISSAIMILILYMSVKTYFNTLSNKNLLEGQQLETIWTSIPAIILILIAFPSLQLLYMMEEISLPMITIKIIAHQWYWSYQYTDFSNIEFDSFISMNYNIDSFRLLETDNQMMVPINITSRLLITSADVIHSWAIPALGVKMDAVPGRLNQTIISPSRPGLYFGQCSEICGAKHSFMPITMKISSTINYMSWLNSQ